MTRIKLFSLLIFLSAIFTLNGCKKDDSNECTGGHFNFLTVGNHWISSLSGLFYSDTLILATALEETEPGIFKFTTYTEPAHQLNGTYYLQDCGDFLLRATTLPIKPEDKTSR